MSVRSVPISLNGKPRDVPAPPSGPLSVQALLQHVGLAGTRVAVEVNGAVVPRAQLASRSIAAGDRVEVVTFVGGGDPAFEDGLLKIGPKTFTSRLFLGTGKYASHEQTLAALE